MNGGIGMKMKYPDELIRRVNAELTGHRLEGLVTGRGPQHPQLMVVGEAPGRTEIETHVPFCGAAGKELTKSLAAIGLRRDDVYITSVVRSRPYALKRVQDKRSGQIVEKRPNRPPTKREVRAFAPVLDWEVDQVAPQLIVTVGNTALQRLLGSQYTVGAVHGQLFMQPLQRSTEQLTGKYEHAPQPTPVIPLFHPAAVFYNRKLQPQIEADWQRVAEYIATGE